MKTSIWIPLTLVSLVPGCRSVGPKHDGPSESYLGERVRTISATLRVSLALEDDAPIELEGIFVAELPHSYRLQFWKLRQPVFDVMRTRRGIWVLNRLEEEGIGATRRFERGPFESSVTLIAGGFPLALELRSRPMSEQACFRQRTRSGSIECCPNAGRVACTLVGKGGDTGASATFSGFRDVGPGEWPTDVTVDGDLGSLRLTFDQVEINESLGPEAFKPPRQAKKVR